MKIINKIKGQSMVEYMLVFVAVVTVLFAAYGPNGFLTNAIDDSLETAFESVDRLAEGTCYEGFCPNEGDCVSSAYTSTTGCNITVQLPATAVGTGGVIPCPPGCTGGIAYGCAVGGVFSVANSCAVIP